MEVTISAYDQDVWVADIDILGLFSRVACYDVGIGNVQFSLMPQILPGHCGHGDDDKLQYSRMGELISVDCWSEFLGHPSTTAVVRASGNWIARLALAAVMLERGDTALICGGQVCWACVAESLAVNTRTSLVDRSSIFVLC